MSEQIQNISNEILEYKNKFFFKIFSDFLREKKAPFPENVTHYLDLLFPYELIKPNEITLNSIRKENNEYVVSLTGPFDSYIEINGASTNFNSEGKIINFNVPALIKADDVLNFYLSIVNFPYKKEKPVEYTNNKTAQNIIDTIQTSESLRTYEMIEEPVIGVLKYINNIVAKYNIDAQWISKKDPQNSTIKELIMFTNNSNVPVKIVFNNQEYVLFENNHIDVPFDLDEFLEVYKNSNYNQAIIKNSEGTDVSTVTIANLLTQDELNNVRLGMSTAIERSSDAEFPAKIRPSLSGNHFFAKSGYYINFMGSIVKIPPQTEAVLGVPVSKAEVLAMDENNKKIFVCDKNGDMIGKSITPTIFAINNVKLIKASIK